MPEDQAPQEDSDTEEGAAREPVQPLYIQLLQEINRSEVFSLDINMRHVHNHPRSRELYQQLVRFPQELVPLMDFVVHHEYCRLFGAADLHGRRIQVCLHILQILNLTYLHILRRMAR